MKKFLDFTLVILFFACLASNFLPAQVHQVLGLIFIALIVAHNVLNRNFYRAGFNRRRIFNLTTIFPFASGILAILISGAALADYFQAPNLNWRSIHLGAAIFSTILLMIHLLKHIRGKKLYAATALSFILAVGAIFGLPYVDRWFHTVKIDKNVLLGEKLNVEGKILIVYFSRVGNTNFPEQVDAVSGASLMLDDKKIIGNAQMIAELVQSIIGGEIFAIQTEKTYPADYSQTTKVAKEEFNANELPKLKNLPEIDAYDKIILIYPLWWSTLPKPVENFLRSCDLSGKKIYPIATHGGGGFGNSIETLKNYAEIGEPLEIYSSDILVSRKIIFEWLKSSLLNFSKVTQ